MPITPERLETRQEVRGAIASHFWEAAVQSSQSLDGLAYTLPGEPAPVLPAPSGLSRQQLLLALQALSLPLIPAFDGAAGGLVSVMTPAHLQVCVKLGVQCLLSCQAMGRSSRERA